MSPDPTSLDRLHDILPPSPAPWWPPAPAWYWMLSALAILVLSVAAALLHHRLRNRYRREALAELARIEARLRTPSDRPAAVVALADLIKRCALSAFPRATVASLVGKNWMTFLDRTGRRAAFSADIGHRLSDATYDPEKAASLNGGQIREIVAAIRHWIRHHRIDMAGPNSS